MNPMMMMKPGVRDRKGNEIEGVICELIGKIFTTRNLLHFAHWSTKSYAQHMALGDLYDQVVEDLDSIVETYMGKFGPIKNLYCEKAELPSDITKHVKSEAAWVGENRMFISKGETSIENLIDNLLANMHRCVYKLEQLH